MATSKQITNILISGRKSLNQAGKSFGPYARRAGILIYPDGLVESINYITTGTKRLDKFTTQFQLNKIRQFYSIGNKIVETQKLRPQESGNRPESRMTGTIRFGPNAAFNATQYRFDDLGVAGINFVNIPQADQATDYIWRAVEFGLPPKGQRDELSLKGPHILPRKFGFDGSDRFFPISKRGDVRLGAGTRERLFATKAILEVTKDLRPFYAGVLVKSFITS